MREPDYGLILSTKFPGREWVFLESEELNIVFSDGGPQISVEELDALWPEIKNYATSFANQEVL